MSDIEVVKGIRKCEDDFYKSFSITIPITENLIRYRDDKIKDKYDFNSFCYSSELSDEDYNKALEYQIKNGYDFLKFDGKVKLRNRRNLEEDKCATMLFEGNKDNFIPNNKVVIKTPTVEEIIPLELKEYGPIYGESFTKRNIIRLNDVVKFIGAYINNELVGYCYIFDNKEYKNIDGLLVDKEYRKQGIASTLLMSIVDNKTFLHADFDDTPIELYKKLGFIVVDESFEYFLMLDK